MKASHQETCLCPLGDRAILGEFALAFTTIGLPEAHVALA